MTEPEKPPAIIDHTDAYAEFFGKIVEGGITGSASFAGKIIELIGRVVEGLGSAAASLDPLQFAFMVGSALIALTYFDTTEPYATLIRKLKLHDLIALLHAPGTQGQDIKKFQEAVNQCIKEHNDAGVSVPDSLAALSTATNFLSIGHLMEQLIPGSGIADTFVTGVFNRFGIRTAAQFLADTIPSLKAWCDKDIADRRRKPLPPPGSSFNTICVFYWRYKFTGNLGVTWGTRAFDDVDTAIRSWDATNLVGAAGNLLEVTKCTDQGFSGQGPPPPGYPKVTETIRVIKQSSVHSDIN